MGKAKVYFIKKINSENLINILEKLPNKLVGNVAIKVHSGEEGNQNFLHPEFYCDLVKYLHGTIVETNTAYEGSRNTTIKHKKLLEKHNWNKYFQVDLLDEFGDLELKIPDGKIIKKNYVGKNLEKYDSMLIVSHFKGHPMGGYGGALKQLSIGCSSSYGKAYIHGAGIPENIWTADHNKFLEAMVDAAKSVVEYFNGHILYINVMANMSVDCDCCREAKDPCISDIGILASTDPVALDKACVDLVYQSKEQGAKELIARIESRNGIHTINEANKSNLGSLEYELEYID